ncbi:MAG: polymerase alpha subunit [Pseudomonadota bacterium]
MSFAHLHVHSQMSLLNGVPSPKDLAKAAAKLGMTSLALTDTCNLYGAVTFMKACKDAGVHAVHGVELWVDPRGIGHRADRLEEAWQLVLLIEDATGYRNACELVTRAIFDGIHYRPRVDLALLERHAAGLIALTSGEAGPIGRDRAASVARVERLAGIFGRDHLYCELMDHGVEGQPGWCDEVRAVAAHVGLSTVVTNDVRYVAPQDAVNLDLLNAIAWGASINDKARPRLVTDQQYLKSEAEMRELFASDAEALERTAQIAERCHFKYDTKTYYFPASTPPDAAADADTDANWAFFYAAFPPPIDFGLPLHPAPPRPEGAGNLDGYFRWYARRGLELRLRDVPAEAHPPYVERLERELGMILKMGFPAYLLIVAEFINWAKDRAIPVGPGRGSAAGSLVAYAMRITDIDPVRFSLLFERFLNPERISMPDIDVDFAQDRREEVIEHVREKYGSPLVAQIITYGKLQAKAALKDAARVCDLAFGEGDRITKLVPNQLNITLAEAWTQEPRLRALVESDPKVRRVWALATRLEGAVRQTGVHAAGVVIADRPLVQLTPLYRDGPEGGPVVQYDMKSAETIGLIKFDFLGLKTLDQVRDAVAMVARNTGETIDMARIDVDDVPTWQMLQKGDALGVFQVESSGMRELLTRLRPSCLDDLVALVALFRPGPLSSGMVDDFIDRKHGRKQVEYPFPELEEILGSTYGTIVYQEQVMQCAQVLAGYSLGEADLLRRAMGKKDAAEMGRQKTRFVDGAVAKGHPEGKVTELFDLLAKFAEYGFNKSHSAAYGYVAYQTAFLKAHHRAEYMAALMTIDRGDSDKILVYTSDCRRAGIAILPPDVQESVGAFDVPASNRRAIRYGLGAVKGIGDNAADAIVEARAAAGGRFAGFLDLLERLDWKRVNRRVVESLVKCGALDGFGEPRARLMAALEGAIASAQDAQARRTAGQVGLFGAVPSGGLTFQMPKVGEWPVGERMRHEKDALGFFLTGHPVEDYADEVARWATAPLDQLERVREEADVAVCGMPATLKIIKTKKTGEPMAFVQLEDLGGSVEVVFFPRAFAASRAVLESGRPMLVRGKLERKAEGVKVLAEGVEAMDELREKRTRAVAIHLRPDELADDGLDVLRALLESNRGACPAHVVVEDAAAGYRARVRLGEGWRVTATRALVDGIRGMAGRSDAVRLS